MRVVLDTNVLVRATKYATGPARELLRLLQVDPRVSAIWVIQQLLQAIAQRRRQTGGPGRVDQADADDIHRGADVNARAEIDAECFGGHTPLFHTTVTLSIRGNDALARLLLRSGADPNLRATFRKKLTGMGDGEKGQMREYHAVTAIGFARQFQVPDWVDKAAIAAIAQHGGE